MKKIDLRNNKNMEDYFNEFYENSMFTFEGIKLLTEKPIFWELLIIPTIYI